MNWRWLMLAALLAACGKTTEKTNNDTVVIVDGNNTTAGNNTTGATNNQTMGTNGMTTDGGDATIGEFIQRYRSTFCDAIFNCPNATTLGFLRVHSRYGVTGCESSPDTAYPDRGDIERGIEAGTIEFDPSGVETCLKDLHDAFCDGTWGRTEIGIASCIAVLHGVQSIGDSCVSGSDCAEGYCPTDQVCGERTCSQTNLTCGATICDAGSYCDQQSDTCHPRVAEGEVCDLGQCEKGSYCTVARGGICAGLGTQGAGAPCVLDYTCEVGLVCQDSACAPPQFGAAGDECSLTGDRVCEPGLVCRVSAGASTGTCGDPLPIGSSCAATWACAPDTMCDSWAADPVCTAYFADGAVCQSSAQCASQSCPGGMGSAADGTCESDCTH